MHIPHLHQLTEGPPRKPRRAELRSGDWVRVRSRDEILATLDAQGRLDRMPFMPEMLGSCGKTLKVYKRAHKTCDTIAPRCALRRLDRTVHLVESRCDGSAHGGCDAACLLFWNEAWLEPADAPIKRTLSQRSATLTQRGLGCSAEQLAASTQAGHHAEKGPQYVCQTTELQRATRPMPMLDVKQYVEDYRSGNVDLATMLRGAVYRVSSFVVRYAGGLGRRAGVGEAMAKPLMAIYDVVQRLVPHGVPFPRRLGLIPMGQPTPQAGIRELKPGSRVQVKPYREILETLDRNNRTRGLYFDAEHVPYCSKVLRVRSIVNQIVNEQTGYMLHFKTPSVILQGAFCGGTYSDSRLFCPRSIYPYWRTIWLTPIDSSPAVMETSAQLRTDDTSR